MTLNHFIFVFFSLFVSLFFISITSECEYLLKQFPKVTKYDLRRSVRIPLHNLFWVQIQNSLKIFSLYISTDIKVFLQVTRNKPEKFGKKVQK